ncbi:transmembrane protein, putative [Bodo saltans]|uniref:Transmembrane protein, putative n=1 Tax=Bodo saltans TaxID=75058 RepID=A0A0S4JAQ9_BODSA|nr:transmembrane protein, putative [Bodo saltans]|eukprot:CUG87087.1 transmembrane protein, putative [Bodo saltans]
MSCNTMAFSITPYFSSDAKHDFFMGETMIGLVFASFPMGYMITCVCMSLANISHLKMSTLTLWIRGFVLAFIGFSVMFGLTPTILRTFTSAAAVAYATMFGSMRFLQGVTVAVLDVLILLYITKLYPEQVSAVVGQKEAALGLGVVFGPPHMCLHEPGQHLSLENVDANVVDQGFRPCVHRLLGDVWTDTYCSANSYLISRSLRDDVRQHALSSGCNCCRSGRADFAVHYKTVSPEQVSAVVGQKEAALGLGVVFGPPLGGALYSAGGFKAPPIVTGAIVLSIALVTQLVLWRAPYLRELHALREVPAHLLKETESIQHAAIATVEDDSVVGTKESGSAGSNEASPLIISDSSRAGLVDGNGEGEPSSVSVKNVMDLFRLLPLYTTAGPFCITIFSAACFAFQECMVPLYALDTYGVQAWGVGITMSGAAIVYAFSAVFTGVFLAKPSRHRSRPWVLTVAALVLALGTATIAPPTHLFSDNHTISGINIPHGYAVTVIGVLTCCGGMAMVVVTAVAMLVDQSRATSAVLVPTAAAVTSFGMSFGSFVGPIVGSALTESFHFEAAFFSLACSVVVLSCFFATLVLTTKK